MSDPASMPGEDHPALRAFVDLDAIRHNYRLLVAKNAPTPVMAVVKADAYGHGAVAVARALVEEGATLFAVAHVAQAIVLRQAGITSRILVLGVPLARFYDSYVDFDLEMAVTSVEVADSICDYAGGLRGAKLRVHLEVDTGMHRLGVAPTDVARVASRLINAAGLELVATWTHLATADEAGSPFVDEQLDSFDSASHFPTTHVANSGGALLVKRAAEGRCLTRVGGLLYGLPSTKDLEAASADFRPAMRLTSEVVHLHRVPKGESVSYGRTWVAPEATLVGTIVAGYADGLPRSLSNKGFAGIRGQIVPIVGRVCMDLLMVAIPREFAGSVQLGDEVVLFGLGGPSARIQAAAAETISYALTAGLTARVPRIYSSG
ncbi:alanine racemase [soil metagenome]